MAQTMRHAFAGGDDQEIVRRKTAEDLRTSKIAKQEPATERRNRSRKWLSTPLRPSELYTGADLRKPR